ncbi:MAG: CDP-2,3-bis-(O-geranylgeranyl)-sn-glycerol synthase, partial [Candidatus Aenigmatarchaeota archaeon]
IRISWMLFLVVVTPIIHRTSNIIGFLMKLKKVPW